MTPLSYAFVFVFGTVIGSFVNAVLWRLRTGASIARGRSHCPQCHHELAAKDLVPIMSYLLLGGRCRYCSKGIGLHYPVVEAAMGFLFVLAAGVTAADAGPVMGGDALASLLLRWYLLATLVIVFVYDLRYMLILRKVTLPATAIAAVGNLALGVPLASLLAGMLLGWGFFYLQYRVSDGRWVGGGDLWLGLLMGAILGWPMTALALFISYVSGAVVGVGMLATRRADMRTQVPFGTFLAVGTALTLLYGQPLLEWYAGLLS